MPGRSLHGRRRTGRAATALAARFGDHARSALLTLMILTLPPLTIFAVRGRWHGLPTAAFVLGGAALALLGRRQVWVRSGPAPWLLAYVCWEAASCLLAPDKRTALLGLLATGAGLAVTQAAAALAQGRRLRLLLDSLIAVTLLCAAATVTVALTPGGLHAVSDSNGHLVASGRTHLPRFQTQVSSCPAATPAPSVILFQDGPLLAAFLVTVLPLLLATAASPTRVRRRITAGAAASAGLAALIATGALGPAWPGLLAGLAALGALALRRLPRRQKRPPARRRHPRSARPRSRRPGPFPLPAWAAPLVTALIVAACLVWLGAHEWRPMGLRLPLPRPILAGGLARNGLPLWLAALAAFWTTGLRALGRLPQTGLRRGVLTGALAGVAAQAVDAAAHPGWQSGPALFTAWLLLGLGTACLLSPPSPRAGILEPCPL